MDFSSSLFSSEPMLGAPAVRPGRSFSMDDSHHMPLQLLAEIKQNPRQQVQIRKKSRGTVKKEPAEQEEDDDMNMEDMDLRDPNSKPFNMKTSRKFRKMAREKQKRSLLNDRFETLCSMLNMSSGTRVEKLAILSETIKELHTLQLQNKMMKNQSGLPDSPSSSVQTATSTTASVSSTAGPSSFTSPQALAPPLSFDSSSSFSNPSADGAPVRRGREASRGRETSQGRDRSGSKPKKEKRLGSHHHSTMPTPYDPRDRLRRQFQNISRHGSRSMPSATSQEYMSWDAPMSVERPTDSFLSLNSASPFDPSSLKQNTQNPFAELSSTRLFDSFKQQQMSFDLPPINPELLKLNSGEQIGEDPLADIPMGL